MKKRIICFFLCMVFLLTIAPVTALANDEDTVHICWYLDVDDDIAVAGIDFPYGECFEPAEPGRSDEVFCSWYKDKALTQPFYPDQPVVEDLSLYPLWVPIGQEIPLTNVILRFPYYAYTSTNVWDSLNGFYLEKDSHCEIHRDPIVYNSTYWYDMTTQEYLLDGTFEEGHSYQLHVAFDADPAYQFSTNPATKFYIEADDTLYVGEPVASTANNRVNFIFDAAHIVEDVIVSYYLFPDDEYATGGWSLPKGALCPHPPTPGREDAIFYGWYTDKALTQPFDETKPVMADTQLYPKFIPSKTVIIAWYLDAEDEIAVTGIEHPRGEPYAGPFEPGRDGYEFGGWYYDRELSQPFDPNAPVTCSIELFPKWIPQTSAPVVSSISATLNEPKPGQAIDYGPTISSTPAAPAALPYEVEWYASPDGEEWTLIDVDDPVVEEYYYKVNISVYHNPETVIVNPDVRCDINGQPVEPYIHSSNDNPYVLLTYTWRLIADSESPFTDMPKADHWSYNGINYCIRKGLMNGTSGKLFSPNGTVTRAQLVTILYRAKGSPKVRYSDVFNDVPNGTWYSDAIIWAAENSIVNGTAPGKFNPMGQITREQIATILYRYEHSPQVRYSLDSFPDQGSVSGYAVDALSWATQTGLINGIRSGAVTNLAPKQNATRAQIASIIMRYLEAK